MNEALSSVTQDWLSECCSWKMQTVLFSAIRSCDGVAKEDPCKVFTRALRAEILHNASPNDGLFMASRLDSLRPEQIENFAEDLDRYPLHWALHFIHAAEIVGFMHPDICVRAPWIGLYNRLVDALHLKPETQLELEQRLADGPASPVLKTAPIGFHTRSRSPNLNSRGGYWD
jgi:hypothetical protein